MSNKAKSKQQEALQFLDDLDNMAPPPDSGSTSQAQPGSLSPVPPPAGEAEVYAFIDEITQKSSEPPRTTLSHIDRPLSRAGTPTLTEGARLPLRASRRLWRRRRTEHRGVLTPHALRSRWPR